MTSETASRARCARERKRAAIRRPRVVAARVPDRRRAPVAGAGALGALHVAAPVLGDGREGLRLAARHDHVRQLHERLDAAASIPHYFLQLAARSRCPALVHHAASSRRASAFVVSRLSFRFNVTLLIVFLAAQPAAAAGGHPAAVPDVPARSRCPTFMSENGKMYDSIWGLIAIHVAFQTGFCAFVLSNYMKTIPQSLERRRAGRRRGGRAPVLRDHHAALPAGAGGAGDAPVHLDLQRLPVGGGADPVGRQAADHVGARTTSQGVFFTDNNLIAAGAMLAALPTLIVFAVLQRHFISGLTLGASKG